MPSRATALMIIVILSAAFAQTVVHLDTLELTVKINGTSRALYLQMHKLCPELVAINFPSALRCSVTLPLLMIQLSVNL